MGRAEDLFARLEARGLEAIDELFAEATNEEAFLEFKRATSNGSDAHLHGKDRENLARALSGFANSDGGVVIWGVGTKGGESAEDRAHLADCRRFAGSLDNAVSGCTVPEVPGVRSIPIPLADGSGKGYVATLVPASAIAPHQLVNGKTYLMRAGSSFQPVSHSVLAGMFGRRPQSSIRAECQISKAVRYGEGGSEVFMVWFDVHVYNDTAVVARDAYVTFEMPRLGSVQSTMAFDGEKNARWQVDFAPNGNGISMLASGSNRVAPFSGQVAVNLGVRLVPPFTEALEIVHLSGCDGAPPIRVAWSVPAEHLNALVAQAEPRPENDNRAITVANKLAEKLIGITNFLT